MPRTPSTEPHSSAWVAQVWISWFIAMFAMAGGILFLPADIWTKGYLAMGLLFTVGSTMNLAKTVRDNHEAAKVSAVLHDARIERILAEQDPLK
jgi:hypothetical protein